MAQDATGSDRYGLFYEGDKAIFAVNTVFMVFAIASVTGRFWTRRSRASWLIPEDILVLGALLVYIVQCGLIYVMALRAHAGNRHRSFEQTSLYLRMLFAIQYPWGIELSLVRASIIMFQLRVFGVVRWFRWLAYFILALITSWTIMIIVVALTVCIPIRKGWDPPYPGHCADVQSSYEGIAGSSIALDVMIFTAPLPIIWKLQMSFSRRILLNILFLVGLFDIVCGIMRLVALVQGVLNAPVSAQIWAIIEPSVAIFVAATLHTPSIYHNAANYTGSSGSSWRSIFQRWRMRIMGQQEQKYGTKVIEPSSQSSLHPELSNSIELSASHGRDPPQSPMDKEDIT